MKIILINKVNQKEITEQVNCDIQYDGFNKSELMAENLKEVFGFEQEETLELI